MYELEAETTSAPTDPGNCVVVDIATSPEKGDLMTSLAKAFNGTDKAKLGKDCIFVRPQNMSSGAAAQRLSTNWDENVDGPRPVVWSPAASVVGPDREPAAHRTRAGSRSCPRATRSCSRRS